MKNGSYTTSRTRNNHRIEHQRNRKKRMNQTIGGEKGPDSRRTALPKATTI
jgi:hypothetical protein